MATSCPVPVSVPCNSSDRVLVSQQRNKSALSSATKNKNRRNAIVASLGLACLHKDRAVRVGVAQRGAKQLERLTVLDLLQHNDVSFQRIERERHVCNVRSCFVRISPRRFAQIVGEQPVGVERRHAHLCLVEPLSYACMRNGGESHTTQPNDEKRQTRSWNGCDNEQSAPAAASHSASNKVATKNEIIRVATKFY